MDEETPLIAEHSDSETLTKSLLVDFLGSWCCLELGEYYQNFPSESLKHNPNGRFAVVCGDGEYIMYTALAWRMCCSRKYIKDTNL
ncbi:Coatomer subunit beta'-2 [Camellia lanceoleosa]|uniref:Coatomer subunit beta'-2 n=1 Tax=Camellia lanceoleosa TaxID=1840588 RepID=A0ACC0I9Q9_9ERIC|nr:Coatomer subunit beta'-2 [Camellia lanceoleosa]